MAGPIALAAALQRVARGDGNLAPVNLGQSPDFVFKLRGPHVFARRVDQIADQRGRGGFGQSGVDCRDLPGQEDARADRIGIAAIAVEPVLGGNPAEQGRAGLNPRKTVGSSWQSLGQPCQTPR